MGWKLSTLLFAATTAILLGREMTRPERRRNMALRGLGSANARPRLVAMRRIVREPGFHGPEAVARMESVLARDLQTTPEAADGPGKALRESLESLRGTLEARTRLREKLIVYRAFLGSL